MLKLNLSSPHMSLTISKNQIDKHVENSSKSQSSIGFFSIIHKSLKISIRNGTIVVSIFLSVFLSYCLLAYGVNLELSPLLKDLIWRLSLIGKYHEGNEFNEFLQSGILNDVRRFVVLLLVKWLFSYVIMLFFLMTTISLSSDAYTGKIVSAKDMFSRIKGRWKSPVTTSIYMALISFSLIVLFWMTIALVIFIVGGPLLVGLLTIAIILGVFGYLYVPAIWMLSLVVSIVEDDSCGLKAIDRAGELMKGKKIKGCVMVLLTSCVIFGITFVIMRNCNLANQASLAILISRAFITCLLNYFMFVMFTVFYHECKNIDDEAAAEGDLGSYALVASTEP
ncbi:unnamed protein product [Camellia sinensis]